ncbi:MAG: hypothetical protein P1U85_08400 [Verrucomicrobiales bacterium]|jgi:hypothetical protein|nr:hypothetical protein [Verrucomicrobiales bacterium]
MKRVSILFGVLVVMAFQVSCVTKNDDPAPPESERLSSMPHNIPQSWEGGTGMPGGGMGMSM